MISIAYQQSQTGFVADRIFPIVPVKKQSDSYYVYPRGAFNRDEMKPRAPGTESAGSNFDIDNTPTYYCKKWSLHQDIPDEVFANADDQIDPMRDSTQYLTLKGLINREKRWVSKYFATGLWSFESSGVASNPTTGQFLQWSDANSDPIKTVINAATDVQESTGFRPNTMVLSRRVYDGLSNNPDMIDRIKYGQTPGKPAMATLNILAQLFEVDRVFVMSAIENTSQEGQADSHAFIGGKSALLAYSAPNPGLMVPSAGYTFGWDRVGVGKSLQERALSAGVLMSDFYMKELSARRVEINTFYDQKVVGVDLGFFFKDVVA
jgi:hypothetical protein